jgi:hypothetical protein
MTARSSTERSREFRRRLVQRGQVSLTLSVDDATSAMLRELAAQHGQSIGTVVKVAALVLRRELAQREGAAA